MQVLALDLNQRLVQPSLSGDAQKLSETIHKVQALSKKQGVHQLLNVELVPVVLAKNFKTVRYEKGEGRSKVLGTPLFRLGYELDWPQLRGAKNT